MRNYLLGTVDGECRTQFEEQILFDSAIYEELLVVEQELIEQYLSGVLPAHEKQQFETHFLVTAERQKNLRFGQLLRQYVASHPDSVEQARKTAPAKNPPSGSARFGGPVLVIAAAVLALLGTLVCCLARKCD
jgi:hypothetical protein